MKRFLTILMLMLFIAPLASHSQQRSVGSTFFYDFNGNSLEGWKTIDRDEDGNSWLISEDGYIYSESANAKPNNIIATTEKYAIYATSKISFDVRPLSTENFAENYGIVYSEDGEYFYTIHNVTLESAAEWKNVEFALDYCAGKEIYIGILHNSVENQSAILVDNVRLTDGKLPSVSQVVATENGDNVNITWNAPATEDANYDFYGYKLYRTHNDENTVILTNDLTETSYTDATWTDAEWGIYNYGVSALYTEKTRNETNVVFEENFETTNYYSLPEGWIAFSDPATANQWGNWYVTNNDFTSNIIATEGAQFAYTGGGDADNSYYYLVTPSIDLTSSIDPILTFKYIAPGAFEDPGNPISVKCSESQNGPWEEVWNDNEANFMWKDASLDLSQYSGKVIYIAFVSQDISFSNFGGGIDHVVIKGEETDGPIPLASDIVWSNLIEKDMFTNVYINLATDDNAYVYGASVTLQNINEAEYKYEATANEEGEIILEVRRGVYEYTVSFEGYYSLKGTIDATELASLSLILEKMPDLIEGLYVSPTAWAMWDYEGTATSFDVKLNGELVAQNITERYYQHDITSLVEDEDYTTTIVPVGDSGSVLEYTWTYSACYNYATATDFKVEENEGNAVLSWTMPTYEPESDPVYDFSFDFDNGSLNGWTTLDADGDGRNWQNTSTFANQGFGIEDSYCVASVSYDTEHGAFDPDNYLITDMKYAITSGSKLRFSVAAQSKAYPAEHYGIAISTKTNNANDFEIIYDETLTAGETDPTSIQSQWFNREIDLSAYNGKRIYIAVRHYNSADNSWLLLDNISLTDGATRGDEENGDWLFYDNGICESAFGNFDMSGNATQIFWAIMFPADIISDYSGKPLTKVSMFDYCEHKGAFSIHKGGDTAPGEMIHIQSYETTGTKQYVEFELETPVVISGNENIWIQFSNEYGSGTYPAAYSADMGDPNSRWQSSDGSYWYDSEWYGEGWYGTWMIRAFVSNEIVMPDAPTTSSTEAIGTLVFRNGELLTPEPIKETSFTDIVEDASTTYEYTIRVVYGGEKDYTYYAMSCPLTEEFILEQPLVCTPPQNLYGETTFNEDGTFGATLVWPYVKEWLYYDNGEVQSAIGAGGTIYWGVMFPAEDLTAYAGASISKIALFDFEAGNATLSISFGGNTKPETTVHSQDFTFEGTQEIFELELTYPMPISGEENVWITLYQNGAQYPAAVTADTGDPNGRWCSMDGNSWGDLMTMGNNLNFTWFLRAYVSNEAKGGQVQEIEKFQGNVGGELSVIKLAQPKTIATSRAEATLDHYNIYRSTTNGNYELIEETTDNRYFDEIEKGTYYYQVTAVYTRGEESCESEPATAYNNAANDYVVVEVTAINENGVKGMMIYPNPTKDNLNITAENMTRITIFNALGQVMYDNNVYSDNEIINMTQYEAGVYMVRISTETGVAVKRISVVR